MIIEPNDVLTNDGRGAGDTYPAPQESVPLERSDGAGFPPPDDPIKAFCMHCGKEYMSSEMIPPDGPRTAIMMEGMWWCGTPGCNAGGFGLDIFPVDPEWKDPKGLLEIITTPDDDEFEWDDEDEEDEGGS